MLPFTTRYNQMRTEVLKVITTAEPANSLQSSVSILYAQSTQTDSPDTLRQVQHFKQRVRVEVVELIAALDPDPIAERNSSAETECRQEGDRVRRREEQKIDDQCNRGHGVEGEICGQG